MAFCPICYPDIIEDGDGDRYLPGPMITDEETGELVEDEGERTHIPDEGDVCDRHNVYVSGHRDEGGVWGHPSLTRMLELARVEYRRNPESAKLGEALRLSPECLKDSIRTYAQADDDSDQPHENLHLALIDACVSPHGFVCAGERSAPPILRVGEIRPGEAWNGTPTERPAEGRPKSEVEKGCCCVCGRLERGVVGRFGIDVEPSRDACLSWSGSGIVFPIFHVPTHSFTF